MSDIRLCPKCNSKTYVIDTRVIGKTGEVRRRKSCLICGYRYSTREILYDYQEPEVDRLKHEIEDRLEMLSNKADRRTK